MTTVYLWHFFLLQNPRNHQRCEMPLHRMYGSKYARGEHELCFAGSQTAPTGFEKKSTTHRLLLVYWFHEVVLARYWIYYCWMSLHDANQESIIMTTVLYWGEKLSSLVWSKHFEWWFNDIMPALSLNLIFAYVRCGWVGPSLLVRAQCEYVC